MNKNPPIYSRDPFYALGLSALLPTTIRELLYLHKISILDDGVKNLYIVDNQTLKGMMDSSFMKKSLISFFNANLIILSRNNSPERISDGVHAYIKSTNKQVIYTPDKKVNFGRYSRVKLTRTEIEIIHDISRGYVTAQISKARDMNIKTVSSHKLHAFKKIGIKNIAEFLNVIYGWWDIFKLYGDDIPNIINQYSLYNDCLFTHS